MVKTFFNTIVQQTCGVSILGIFRLEGEDGFGSGIDLDKVLPTAGCGYVIAGFTTERPAYGEAYKILKKRWPIVFQSEVRTNTRTNRKFFFCIYDTKGKVNGQK